MSQLKTITNIQLKRMSIDQLVALEAQVFDQHGEDSEMYQLVLSVLEAKESAFLAAEKRVEDEAKLKQQQTEELRSKIDYMLKHGSMRKMDAIYQVFGHEYIDDYVIDDQNFIIKSLVAREDQNDMWHLDDIDQVNSKIKTLIYDRVYDRYIRRGSYGMLTHFYEEVFGRIVLMDESDKGE